MRVTVSSRSLKGGCSEAELPNLKEIPHNLPSISSDDVDAVTQSLHRNWLAQGSEVESFERALCAYVTGKEGDGICSGVAVSSGTAALFLALYALGVGSDDEVILPSYTCTAVLNAVNMIRAKPVVVDVDPTSWNLSYDATVEAISPATKAIIVTHTFGAPADVEGFMELGIPIVEDCAQALGATIRSRLVGSFGTVAVFSFYVTKVIATGQGGMIISSSGEIIDRIRDYRDFDCPEHYIPRFNFQMTDFQAALGLSQLDKLESFIERRHKIWTFYKRELSGYVNGWQQTLQDSSRHNGYRQVALVEDAMSVKSSLEARGIHAIIPMERYEMLHNYLGLDPTLFRVTESLSDKTLSLPAYPTLTKANIREVVESVKLAVQEKA